jgi:hypothetical protein
MTDRQAETMPTVYVAGSPTGERLVFDGEHWQICYGGKTDGGYTSLPEALEDLGVDIDTVPDHIKEMPGWSAPRCPKGCCPACFDERGKTVQVQQYGTGGGGRPLYACPQCNESYWRA